MIFNILDLKEEYYMNWSTLLYLACPLIMIFCMIGMRGSKNVKTHMEEPVASQQELQQLQIKMAELIEKNHHLSSEVQTLKEQKNSRLDL